MKALFGWPRRNVSGKCILPRVGDRIMEPLFVVSTRFRPAGDRRPVAAVVTRVADIEENHWCPRLGLKGKVDASVEVALHRKPTRVPLELKTGRHTFSHDHKAQVGRDLSADTFCSGGRYGLLPPL